MGNDLANPPEVPPVHRARMPVSVELLHQLLKLPDETRIIAGNLTPDGRTLEFVIEDDRLAAVYEGQEIPTNIPNYVSYGHRTGTLIQVIWAFGSEEVRTGDTLPDNDVLTGQIYLQATDDAAPVHTTIEESPLATMVLLLCLEIVGSQ